MCQSLSKSLKELYPFKPLQCLPIPTGVVMFLAVGLSRKWIWQAQFMQSVLVKVGNTSIQIQIEVWDSHDESRQPKQVTEGIFTFVAVDVKGNKRQIPEEVKQKFLAV